MNQSEEAEEHTDKTSSIISHTLLLAHYSETIIIMSISNINSSQTKPAKEYKNHHTLSMSKTSPLTKHQALHSST